MSRETSVRTALRTPSEWKAREWLWFSCLLKLIDAADARGIDEGVILIRNLMGTKNEPMIFGYFYYPVMSETDMLILSLTLTTSS